MSKIQKHILYLFAAELQFRLASAVNLATTLDRQPLDLPKEWSLGKHHVEYEEIALRQDQAEFAARTLYHSAIYTMAMAVKEAIEVLVPKLPDAVRRQAKHDIKAVIRKTVLASEVKSWKCSDDDVITAYHIARLIRNAYAHAPFRPVWSIHEDLRDMMFVISDVIELHTKDLHGADFDWRHYGGSLAMLKFCRYVRFEILGDELLPRKQTPNSESTIFQYGDLILEKVDGIPSEAVLRHIKPLSDGGIPIGGGYVFYPGGKPGE